MNQPSFPYRVAKRAFDLAVAIVLAPVALPLCLILLVAIRLESPGAPLFVQQRVGRDRKPFRMLKLRTMRSDTEHAASHLVGAAQITRLGAVLRKLKLDELPQLANILSGSMALVGPRPCLPDQDELIEEREKRDVFAVRPGVTGAAQIRGIDMSEPARLAEADARYIENADFFGDLSIIVRTATGGGRGDAATRRFGDEA
ncbi:sugar transferase [Pseudoblastomonas halimionae]|uniref:Sugar transferase n=1 Tax=Alteriqipengyuania halimionae TaxID=1926630 RepID=A0A6I4U8U7_9SPHN|nr:sugar transferase [Alteriqipengyuania halimionae]MXP10922.1 sugar transferase [Alteriqipengyuania halimionae]